MSHGLQPPEAGSVPRTITLLTAVQGEEVNFSSIRIIPCISCIPCFELPYTYYAPVLALNMLHS